MAVLDLLHAPGAENRYRFTGRFVVGHFGGFFPLFLLLSVTLLLFLAMALLLARRELMSYCHDDVSTELARYLQQRSTDAVLLDGRPEADSGLHGLDFVRLSSGDRQSLYSDKADLGVALEDLVNLDPHRSAVWLRLGQEGQRGRWTVVAKVLDNGYVVQAGKQHPHAVALYDRLKMMTALLALLAVFSALAATLWCRRRNAMLWRRAEQSLQQLAAGDDAVTALDGETEEIVRLVRLFQHLSARNRRLVREMQQSLDNVAHDLRTPMTRLRSVAEYGLQQRSPERLAEALADCLEESERVLSMLSIMMSVAEAEAGAMRLGTETVHLAHTIADVVTLYEYVADERQVELHMDIAPHIMITADRTRITQVWANLVDNGIKYGRQGGYVRMSARQEEGGVAVIFEDNGIGISSHEQARIWERLYRGDRSRSRPGLGLGLSYVRAVVEAHGGKVSVNSTLGEGSTFVILLKEGDSVKARSQISGA